MLIIQRPTVEALDEEESNRQRFAIGPLEPIGQPPGARLVIVAAAHPHDVPVLR